MLPATNNPVQNRMAQDVLAWSTAELIATESVTLASTSSITSSGSAGRVGDALMFTSGTLDKTIFSITAVSGTTYTLGQIASVTPTGGDTFQILRYRPAIVGSGGGFVIGSAETPTEANTALTVINTEYSYAIPAATKTLQFQCRQARDIRFAFTAGKVAGSVSPYQTLKAGNTYYQDFLSLTSKTIYFATSANAGDVVEVLTWQ